MNRYMGLAREALRATGAKLRKIFVDVFIDIMFLFVSVGKVIFAQMVFFSTDTKMDAGKCVAVYKSRFQLEFVFRDGNQFTGLEDCQARSKEKLDFAFNASLAAINTAKAAIMEMGEDLSIGEYTALMHSTLIYQRIMCVSGIKPDPAINRRVMNELVTLAKNAA